MKYKKSPERLIAESFVKASKQKDFEKMARLLDESGEFEIHHEHNVIGDIVGKSLFIDWYTEKLKNSSITEVDYDQCVHCEVGAPVVLLNKGKFPRHHKESHERSKAGLMIKVLESKIFQIKFCYVFLRTKNKYVFECQGKEIKKLIMSGMSEDEAIERVIGIKFD